MSSFHFAAPGAQAASTSCAAQCLKIRNVQKHIMEQDRQQQQERLSVPIEQKRYMNIEYPGIVKNVDKVLETLGGETAVSKTYRSPSQRMELKWRPKDVYCNSCWAERNPSTNLLMKVKRKKKANGEYEYTAVICGTLNVTYRYQDFQYMPMTRTGDNSYKSLRDQLIIKRVEHSSWLQKPTTLYLPPQFFSRCDTPSQYMYRPEPKSRGDSMENKYGVKNKNLIGVARHKRSHYTQLVYHVDKTIPMEPIPEAWDKIRSIMREKAEAAVERAKAMFEKRPIWSKNSLCYHMKEDKTFMKFIMPLVSYFMCTGPWRMMWIRHGYDPRKDPSAKIYQTIDFRFRQRSSFDTLSIGHKRSAFHYITPNVTHRGGSAPSIIQTKGTVGTASAEQPTDSSNDSDGKLMSSFRFTTDIVPPCRQTFYQICDIEVEEIQEMLHGNDGKEKECHEREGWLLPDTHEKARRIMYDIVEHLLPTSDNDPGSMYNVTIKQHPLKKKGIVQKRKALTPLEIKRRKTLGLPESDSEDEVDDDNDDDDDEPTAIARELMSDD
ncbi:general transcription factor 3C polypeptide 5-like isoform X2 [Tubulanus polymorphus]|uniref:general transcription factor 3C polypeptide 5-like isoform X2 n=1 Tax=Tubulanus polymorphus TaxID=672921 RepID=UPI003DA5928D